MHRLQDAGRDSREAARLNNDNAGDAATGRHASGYCGRFAPSPSGPLHFGSLIAALGSYLQARCCGGRWLLRIEDLDTPRNQPGAVDTIQRQLDALGLVPDGRVLRQSSRLRTYLETLEALNIRGLTFPCACSRGELGDTRYPGTCRDGIGPGRRPRSVRLRAENTTITVEDALQATFRQNIELDVGDFVIRRADNIIAYHLAVVVDDAWQEVTEVVRGADLLDSTPRQIFLQQQLRLPTPRYVHLPLAVDADGSKLSKQSGAPAIDPERPALALTAALRFLGHVPPPALARATASTVLQWAIENWSLAKVPRAMALPCPAGN